MTFILLTCSFSTAENDQQHWLRKEVCWNAITREFRQEFSKSKMSFSGPRQLQPWRYLLSIEMTKQVRITVELCLHQCGANFKLTARTAKLLVNGGTDGEKESNGVDLFQDKSHKFRETHSDFRSTSSTSTRAEPPAETSDGNPMCSPRETSYLAPSFCTSKMKDRERTSLGCGYSKQPRLERIHMPFKGDRDTLIATKLFERRSNRSSGAEEKQEPVMDT
uniref:Myb_DNA-bind_5 domain-containing protein n=1 Tax=Steinernema glaseri TaxID=37863 RepID=A0A1I7YJ30_9BILA